MLMVRCEGKRAGTLPLRGREMRRVLFSDAERFTGLEIALAAKPVFHGCPEAVERDAEASFEKAVGDGERIVKDGVVGEVAHGEAVDPLNGAGMGAAFGVNAFDLELAEEHCQLRSGQLMKRPAIS